MNEVSLFVNGRQVTHEQFEHSHGQAGDLFLRLNPQETMNGGDRVEWSGPLPEGKTRLWVRYTMRPPDGCASTTLVGNALLRESDRRVTSPLTCRHKES